MEVAPVFIALPMVVLMVAALSAHHAVDDW